MNRLLLCCERINDGHAAIELGDIGSRVKFKTVYADSVKVESGLPGYRVVIKSEAFEYGANFRVYGLEKIRGLSIFVY